MECPTSVLTGTIPVIARPTRSSGTSIASKIASRVAARFALTKTATIVLRDTPAPGWAWGWYADVEPRMAIEPMGIAHRGLGRIYLETPDGHRTFEPVGRVPAEVLAPLRSAIKRGWPRIAQAWTRTMLAKGWLHLGLAGLPRDGRVWVAAYQGTANLRVHLLPGDWTRIIGSRSPQPEDVDLDWNTGELVIGARGPKPVRWSLASILWPEEEPHRGCGEFERGVTAVD
jgi:hypothetical protein